MISLAVAYLLAAPRPVAETYLVEVDQDVWVYPHASDPAGDSFLRVWGAGGKAVAANAADAEDFSYSYLRFSFDKVPSDKKLVGAYMFLKPAGTPEISESSKSWPLEVRPLKGKFLEKDWAYTQVGDTHPSETEIYGTGVVTAVDAPGAEKEFEIKIDLLGKDSKFGSVVGKAIADKQPLYLALTSKYDVSELGMKGVYKVYSKENKGELIRPRLVLKFE